MTTQEAESLITSHGGSQRAAAKAAGVSRKAIWRALHGQGGKGRAKAKAAPKATPQVAGRTIADFRKEHDQTWKIRDGIRRLFGGGVIMTDAEFRAVVGGHAARWRTAADDAEFRGNRYRVGGELLWASVSTITEMRKIRGEAV